MAKPRTALSRHQAVSSVIGLLDQDEIKAVTGKTQSWFSKCSDADLESHEITVIDAARLGAALLLRGEAEPFTAALTEEVRRQVEVQGGEPVHRPEDIRDRVTHLMAEFGDIAREVHVATHGDSPGGSGLTVCELRRIAKEAGQAMDVLTGLLRDIESMTKQILTVPEAGK